MEPLSFKQSAKASTRNALVALSVAVALAGMWVLYTFPPETSTFYPRCVFRSVTGLECPGCGTTRALHHLLHGRVGEAFRLNPMLFAIGAAGLFALPDLVRGKTAPFLMKPWFAWMSLIGVVGWWIVRNLY